MRSQPLTFQLQSNTDDFNSAVKFAQEQAYQWYQCEPSEKPERIYAAKAGLRVVATVGVTETHKQRLLPLQQLYNLETAVFPSDWRWESVVQFSWFFSTQKGCFITLLLMAIKHCLDSGKCYAILQMKDVVSSILKEKGLKLKHIPCAQLHADRITGAEQPYYEDPSSVRLYYLDFIDSIHSIKSYLFRNEAEEISYQCTQTYCH